MEQLDNAQLIEYNQTSPLTLLCNALGNIMHPQSRRTEAQVDLALAILKTIVDAHTRPVKDMPIVIRTQEELL